MAFTQEQLSALEAAIAEGTLVVQYADKRVQYRSLDEMIRIRDIMKTELGTGKTRRVYAEVTKGL